MIDFQQPGLAESAAGLVGPVLSACAGLVMRHAQRYQAGRPFSWLRLVVDIPTVVGLGIVGGGAGEYFELGVRGTLAITALLAYFGPQALELIFLSARQRGGVPPVASK